MIKKINFHFFYFSTYFLIILVSFIISFIVFYQMTKDKYSKLDIAYIFAINILGFMIGSKIFHIVETSKVITLSNLLNSGYSFVGGILGSSLLVFLYCKKYRFNFANMEVYFTIIYPLIYSISKLACFTNECCKCIIPNFPLQLLESIFMFILFVYLYKLNKNKENYFSIGSFLMLFGIIRFIVDYFRYTRNILFLNLTLVQLICGISIVIGLTIFMKSRK